MNEIELFFKTVESEIRCMHASYLKKLKRVPVPSDKAKKIPFKKVPVDEKLLKGYNKGVEEALKALQLEFKRFTKRMDKEPPRGSFK